MRPRFQRWCVLHRRFTHHVQAGHKAVVACEQAFAVSAWPATCVGAYVHINNCIMRQNPKRKLCSGAWSAPNDDVGAKEPPRGGRAVRERWGDVIRVSPDNPHGRRRETVREQLRGAVQTVLLELRTVPAATVVHSSSTNRHAYLRVNTCEIQGVTSAMRND